MIRKAIAASSALAKRDVQVFTHGSYRNNTKFAWIAMSTSASA
jgi:hypothetical protein